MDSLQNDFLKRSVAALEGLTERAKNAANLPPEFLRETFRTLHTIKGTAQTFGFTASAKIAHELENLLSEAKESDSSTKNYKFDLLEGFAHLIDSFSSKDNFSNQTAFFEKINKSKKSPEKLPKTFTFESGVFKQFSEHERKLIVSEVNKGKNIFFVNADLSLTDFAEKLKSLREKLSATGEIIALFPNPKPAEKGTIGFQICFACEKSAAGLREFLIEFSTEIIEQKPLIRNGLDDILSKLAAYGKELAKSLGKDIEIIISAGQREISAEKSKLIFEILLHLLRNAIDHAIETEAERIAGGKNRRAKIKISVKSAKGELNLVIKDDGKGIDAEKIKARAIEKRLISGEETLTESEMLDLIFLHEFSTAEAVTEVSGRGIGLDAVKNLVENSGGKISVKSRRGKGTTFEVFLRYEKL